MVNMNVRTRGIATGINIHIHPSVTTPNTFKILSTSVSMCKAVNRRSQLSIFNFILTTTHEPLCKALERIPYCLPTLLQRQRYYCLDSLHSTLGRNSLERLPLPFRKCSLHHQRRNKENIFQKTFLPKIHTNLQLLSYCRF